MTAVKVKIAEVQSSIRILREAWPFMTHPKWIVHLKRWCDSYQRQLKERTAEVMKDELVQQLRTELDLRKTAYDEAEAQYDEEITDLRHELAGVYAKNAELWATLARLRAGGDPNAVHPEATPADC